MTRIILSDRVNITFIAAAKEISFRLFHMWHWEQMPSLFGTVISFLNFAFNLVQLICYWRSTSDIKTRSTQWSCCLVHSASRPSLTDPLDFAQMSSVWVTSLHKQQKEQNLLWQKSSESEFSASSPILDPHFLAFPSPLLVHSTVRLC